MVGEDIWVFKIRDNICFKMRIFSSSGVHLFVAYHAFGTDMSLLPSNGYISKY